jgi:hypothetical protein
LSMHVPGSLPGVEQPMAHTEEHDAKSHGSPSPSPSGCPCKE